MVRGGFGAADGDEPGEQLELALGVRQSGPLPPASTLAEYEAVMAGLGERIVRMAESSTTDRSRREDKDLAAGIDRDRRGQNAAFIGGGVCLAAAILFFIFAGLDRDARGVFLTAGVVLALFPLLLFIRVVIGDITRHGGSSGSGDLPEMPTLPGM